MSFKIPTAATYKLYLIVLILVSVVWVKYSQFYEYSIQKVGESSESSGMSVDIIWVDVHHDLIGLLVLTLIVVAIFLGPIRSFWREYPGGASLIVKPLNGVRGVIVELFSLLVLVVPVYILVVNGSSLRSVGVALIGAWVYAVAVLRAVLYRRFLFREISC